MASMQYCKLLLVVSFSAIQLLASAFISVAEAESNIGVNYGLLGDNLPSPDKVVALFKSKSIARIRLFDPNIGALQALQNSGIEVVLGTLNQDLQQLASGQSYAAAWVQTYVLPYSSSIKFRYITAGNEVVPGDLANYVLPAMQNLESAMKAAGLNIPVSTVVATTVLGTSYPPSQGSFSNAAAPNMAAIVSYLASRNTPLLLNVYPYFTYAGDMKDVRLDYALFTASDVVVRDRSLGYTNMFDAIIDAAYSALEKAGGASVRIAVSVTGWPSSGGEAGATVENAKIYNSNVVAHVGTKNGTPKRPRTEIETYMFAMFNENLKPAGTEQNFGLYHPDMTQVYHVDFSSY